MDGSEKRRLILIRLMVEKNISNQKLAEVSGLHEVSISRYVSGTSLLNDVKTLEKLAAGLDINICTFFDENYTTPIRTYSDDVISALRHDIEDLKNKFIQGIAPPGDPSQDNNRNFIQPAAITRPKKTR